MQERYEEAGSIANDAISNIRTVASLCAQSKMVEIYECKCQALKAHGIRQGITRAMGYGLSTMLVNCFHGACFFFGAKLVYYGNATIDQVFTVSKWEIDQSLAIAKYYLWSILLGVPDS